ncbi:MAG: hypothetical protein LBV46_03940 [Bacteroidales bacterium]|jgi:hypothetical protein|nr:hypothetical protein [Bacteroidales bacterium]
MKQKYSFLLLLFSVVLLLGGCQKSPEKVCRQFLTAYLAGDFAEAATFTNANTKAILLMQQELLALDAGNSMGDTNPVFAKPKIISVDEESDMDSSKVLFCRFSIAGQLDSVRVRMVFEDQQWVVQFPYTAK